MEQVRKQGGWLALRSAKPLGAGRRGAREQCEPSGDGHAAVGRGCRGVLTALARLGGMALDAFDRSPPRLLTIDQVADLCQVSTKTVYRAIRSGALTACQLGKGGAYRVKPEEMEVWIEACSGRAAPAHPATPDGGNPAAAQRTRAGRRTSARGTDKGRLRVAPGMGRTS